MPSGLQYLDFADEQWQWHITSQLLFGQSYEDQIQSIFWRVSRSWNITNTQSEITMFIVMNKDIYYESGDDMDQMSHG